MDTLSFFSRFWRYLVWTAGVVAACLLVLNVLPERANSAYIQCVSSYETLLLCDYANVCVCNDDRACDTANGETCRNAGTCDAQCVRDNRTCARGESGMICPTGDPRRFVPTCKCSDDSGCGLGETCVNAGTCDAQCVANKCPFGYKECNNDCVVPACSDLNGCGSIGYTCKNPGTCEAACVPSSGGGGCTADIDCRDDDPCTTDTCDSNKTCQHTVPAGTHGECTGQGVCSSVANQPYNCTSECSSGAECSSCSPVNAKWACVNGTAVCDGGSCGGSSTCDAAAKPDCSKGGGDACTTPGPGTNQFVGCVYSDTNFQNQKGNAPAQPQVADAQNAMPSASNSFKSPIEEGWGWGGPNGLADNFAVRWQGSFDFAGGKYQFFSQGNDDGFRLYLDVRDDAHKIWDKWGPMCCQNLTMEYNILPGRHTLIFEYEELYQEARAHLSWKKIGEYPNSLPYGWVDGANCNDIYGWTKDGDTPNQSINVQLFRDGPSGSGTSLGTFAASNWRGDLNGNFGYSTPTPLGIKDNTPHSVYVYGVDSTTGQLNQLMGSPKTLTCAPPAPPTATLTATVWNDSSRSTVWPGYGGGQTPYFTNNAGPSLVVYAGAPYRLNWAASNVQSCTLDGANVSLTDSNDTAAAGGGSWSRTYTLTCNGAGGASVTKQLTLSVPPDPTNTAFSPTSPACGASGNTLTLSWTRPSGYTYSYVRVQDRTDPNPLNWVTHPTMYQDHYNGPASLTGAVSPGHTYVYWIHTDDYASPGHPYSGAPSGSITCGAGNPTTPTATAGSGSQCQQVVLTWSPGGGATGYNIYRSTSNSAPVTPTYSNIVPQNGNSGNQTYTDSASLAAGTPYYYWIQSVGPGGVTSARVAITPASVTPTSCVVPSGEPASFSGSNTAACQQVDLTWTAPTTGNAPDGYYLYRNKTGTVPNPSSNPAGDRIAVVSASSLSYSDTNLPAGTYYYWIAAYNSAGVSTAKEISLKTIASNACVASLVGSDKDIVAVGGSAVPGAAAKLCNNQGDPLPTYLTPKLGDLVTFSLNLCNTNGTAAMTGITVRDSLVNLKQPAGGFNMCFGGSGSSCTGGTAIPAGIGPGTYALSGTEPNQVLQVDLTGFSIPKGQSRTLTLTAQIAVPSTQAASAQRFFQNTATITQSSGAKDVWTPLQQFLNGNNSPVIKEQP